jgi:hypothetical protein
MVFQKARFSVSIYILYYVDDCADTGSGDSETLEFFQLYGVDSGVV